MITFKRNNNLKGFSCLVALALTLAISKPVRPQVPERVGQDNEAARKQQLQRKTYALVDEIAGGALGLKLAENRFYILTASADLLWDHDQPRARALLWDVLNAITATVPLPRPDSKERRTERELTKDLTQYIGAQERKQELLRQVARRDPQLALDMLRNSRWPVPELPAQMQRAGFALPSEKDFEQLIAAEATARDPQKALEVARESLAKGLSFQLFELLFRLNEKDSEVAAKFAGEIIQTLRTRNLATDAAGGQLAVMLVSFSRNLPEVETRGQRIRRLNLNTEQRRDLVDLVTAAALNASADSNLLFAINGIMPEVREFTPERVLQLQRKLAAFSQTLNQDQKLWNEYSSLRDSGTPEDILKLANRAGDERAELEREALRQAVVRGRADSLREYINSDIESESRRRALLDDLDSQQIELAIEKDDTETLEKIFPKVRRKEEAARAMSVLALSLQKRGKHDEAVQVLHDAEGLIKFDMTSQTQTNALLLLVLAYAQVEPPRAFSILERTIDQANDQIAKATLLDKIIHTGVIQKGEVQLRNAQILPGEFLIFRYGTGIAALANVDFDRTKAAADRFERSELRLLARLLLAQSLLQKSPDSKQ